jgi:hypothetical protein
MNKYYKKDPRIPIMLATFPSLMAFAWIILSVFAFLISLEIAIFSLFFSCWLLVKFANLFVLFREQKVAFDNISIDCDILYGEIEDIETISKFRFFPKDVGGIFRRGDSIVVGSTKGEKVVKVNQFICEKVVDGTLFGNHLIVVTPDGTFAFIPIRIGSGSDQPESEPESQAERIEWAFGEIQKMIEE